MDPPLEIPLNNVPIHETQVLISQTSDVAQSRLNMPSTTRQSFHPQSRQCRDLTVITKNDKGGTLNIVRYSKQDSLTAYSFICLSVCGGGPAQDNTKYLEQ